MLCVLESAHFTLEGASGMIEALQLSGLQVMQGIFAQYPQHRTGNQAGRHPSEHASRPKLKS